MTMQRFHLERDPTDPELKRIYADIIQHGFGGDAPINFLTALSVRPDLLNATWELAKSVLVGGKLPGAIKQMIALCISHQNNCRYCSVLHRGVLESAGVESDVVDKVAECDTESLTEPYRSIIAFSLKAAGDPASLTESDFDTLRSQSLADDEIAEVVVMAAFANFINAWADISAIPLDSAG